MTPFNQAIYQCAYNMPDRPRWKATISYEDGTLTFYMYDEFYELGEEIERGPDWNKINKIVIVYTLKKDG